MAQSSHTVDEGVGEEGVRCGARGKEGCADGSVCEVCGWVDVERCGEVQEGEQHNYEGVDVEIGSLPA